MCGTSGNETQRQVTPSRQPPSRRGPGRRGSRSATRRRSLPALVSRMTPARSPMRTEEVRRTRRSLPRSCATRTRSGSSRCVRRRSSRATRRPHRARNDHDRPVRPGAPSASASRDGRHEPARDLEQPSVKAHEADHRWAALDAARTGSPAARHPTRRGTDHAADLLGGREMPRCVQAEGVEDAHPCQRADDRDQPAVSPRDWANHDLASSRAVATERLCRPSLAPGRPTNIRYRVWVAPTSSPPAGRAMRPPETVRCRPSVPAGCPRLDRGMASWSHAQVVEHFLDASSSDHRLEERVPVDLDWRPPLPALHPRSVAPPIASCYALGGDVGETLSCRPPRPIVPGRGGDLALIPCMGDDNDSRRAVYPSKGCSIDGTDG